MAEQRRCQPITFFVRTSTKQNVKNNYQLIGLCAQQLKARPNDLKRKDRQCVFFSIIII